MAEQELQTLGRYQVRAPLGRGGFATVYRALDPNLNREVALKVMHPSMLTDPTFTQRFRREARALAALRHPNIITVYEVSEADGRLYIAMELADGPSLASYIQQCGSIPWQETRELMKPICQALEYAHGQGVVHRDLKPANILIDKVRGPLLTDFGLARLMGAGGGSMSMTMSGGILGTPAYIAPEVWEMESASPSADMYSLGCIVFEMLTGKLLFNGETPVQILRAHDRGPQYPAAWPEGVPAGITAVLNQALERKPQDRYPGAMGLWQALEDAEADARDAASQAQRAALSAEWRAAVEEALQAQSWSAARMALGRWMAVAPGDPAALAAGAEIDRLQAAQHVAAQQKAAEQKAQAEAAKPKPPVAERKPVEPRIEKQPVPEQRQPEVKVQPPLETRQEYVQPPAVQPPVVDRLLKAVQPGEKSAAFGPVQVGIFLVAMAYVMLMVYEDSNESANGLLFLIFGGPMILLLLGIFLPPLTRIRKAVRYVFLVAALLTCGLFIVAAINNSSYDSYLPSYIFIIVDMLALMVLLWLDRARDRKKPVGNEGAGIK